MPIASVQTKPAPVNTPPKVGLPYGPATGNEIDEVESSEGNYTPDGYDECPSPYKPRKPPKQPNRCTTPRKPRLVPPATKALAELKREGKKVTPQALDKKIAEKVAEALAKSQTQAAQAQGKGPRPAFDLLAILTETKLFLGDDKSKIYSTTCHRYPRDMAVALDTIRNSAPIRPAPSRNHALNVCIESMLPSFHGLADILFLEEQKRRLSAGIAKVNERDCKIAVFAQGMFDGFPLGVSGTTPMQINVVMPKETGNILIDRGNALGIDKGDIIILCCCKALSTQPDCNPSHRKIAMETWESFMAKVKLVGKWHADVCELLGIPDLPEMEN